MLADGQILDIDGIEAECFQAPGHTGWTNIFSFAFAHKSKLCLPLEKRVPDPTAPL